MSEYIVVTPDGEETVEADFIEVIKGCLLFHNSWSNTGSKAGYAEECWKSYRLKDKA